MKRITKDDEPLPFSKWKDLANDDWQPSYHNLQNPEKNLLKEALWSEQGGICCYCNQAISVDTGHIEHFRPQTAFPALELDYANLHLCCTQGKEKKSPSYCGMAKGSWFDEEATLSPMKVDIETLFNYRADGHISAAPEASDMAHHLALDSNILVRKRREAISGFLSEDFLNNTNDDELKSLYEKIKVKNASGQYMEYCVAIEQQLSQLVA